MSDLSEIPDTPSPAEAAALAAINTDTPPPAGPTKPKGRKRDRDRAAKRAAKLAAKATQGAAPPTAGLTPGGVDSGAVLGLTGDPAPAAAPTAVSPTADAPPPVDLDALAKTLDGTFKIVGGAVAKVVKVEEVALTPDECTTLGALWAPVLAPYLGSHAHHLPLVMALMQTGAIIYAKVEIYQGVQTTRQVAGPQRVS